MRRVLYLLNGSTVSQVTEDLLIHTVISGHSFVFCFTDLLYYLLYVRGTYSIIYLGQFKIIKLIVFFFCVLRCSRTLSTENKLCGRPPQYAPPPAS